MRGARGFTLIEIVAALVVTSVVALLVHGVLGAGIDTTARMDRAQATISGEAVARALLMDALRHLPDEGGATMDTPLVTLESGRAADGESADVLTFLSYGVGPAPGTGGPWTVKLAVVDGAVHVRAEPVEPRGGAPFDLTLPQAGGVAVRVLGHEPGADWTDHWSEPGRVPAAVDIQLLDDAKRPSSPPLVVQTSLEARP